MSAPNENKENIARAEYSCLCHPSPSYQPCPNRSYAGQVGPPGQGHGYSRSGLFQVKKPSKFTKRETLFLVLLIILIVFTIAAVVGAYFLYDPVKYHYGSKESAENEDRRKRDIAKSVDDETNADEDQNSSGTLENNDEKEIKTDGHLVLTTDNATDKLTTSVGLNNSTHLKETKKISDSATKSIQEFNELDREQQKSTVSFDENIYGKNGSSLQQGSLDQYSGIVGSTLGVSKLLAEEVRSVTEKMNAEVYRQEESKKNNYKNGTNVEGSETNEVRWNERDLCNCSKINMYKTHKGCIPVKKYSTEIVDTTGLISSFPYMVSILSKAFEDDPTELEFRCSGVILGTRLILTGAACVFKPSDWRNLLVRSGSDYWSIGGSLHTVTKYFEGPGNLVALQVTPDFVYNNFVSEMEIIVPTSKKVSWRRALSPGWMYPDNFVFSQRRKFAPITYTGISPKKCLFESTESDCSNICPFTAGHPLTVDGILVGIRGGKHCDVTNITFDNVEGFDKLFFTDMQSKQVTNWLQHIKVLFQYTEDDQERNLYDVKSPINTHLKHFDLKEKEDYDFGLKEKEDSDFGLKEREHSIKDAGVQTDLQDPAVKKISDLLETYINLKNKGTSTPKIEPVKKEDIGSKKLEKIESDIDRLLKVLEKQLNIHDKNMSVTDSPIVRIGTSKNLTTDKRNINENQNKSTENSFTAPVK